MGISWGGEISRGEISRGEISRELGQNQRFGTSES